MDIQTRKINFVQEFLRLRNTKLIEKLEKILLEEKAKNYEVNLKSLSKDKFNKMIDESIEDAKHGNVVDARELKESVKKWK
jgi:low affinity Fe/Cu permease